MSKEANPGMWEYPAHTKAKHDILSSYLGGWYPKLSSTYRRVLFFDGFAGRGRYNDGTQGSPLIALNTLLNHRARGGMSSCEFVFLFVEKDKKNAAMLQSEIAALEKAYIPYPRNIRTKIVEGAFHETASEIVSDLAEQKRSLAPTFAFIDPFGYTGLPMDLLAELLKAPGSEVFVNFMVGHVQRFILRAGQEAAIEELFGMKPAAVMADYQDDQKRVEHLRDVYVAQLKERAGFTWVQTFEMRNSSGNVTYYLIHGTKHREGVRLMKAALWKTDPGRGAVFSDRLAGESVLFGDSPDLVPLEAAMLLHFEGREHVPVSEIEWFAILETPYRETHIRGVLTQLEKSGTISVSRQGARGFNKDTTWIRFP